MAKSNKPIFWSLFAAGGTLAAFLAPALSLVLLLWAFGGSPGLLGYAQMKAFAGGWFGKLFFFGVITLFLWHAAHRLRVTLHDFGLRMDGLVAWVVYLAAALGTGLSLSYLLGL